MDGWREGEERKILTETHSHGIDTYIEHTYLETPNHFLSCLIDGLTTSCMQVGC